MNRTAVHNYTIFSSLWEVINTESSKHLHKFSDGSVSEVATKPYLLQFN